MKTVQLLFVALAAGAVVAKPSGAKENSQNIYTRVYSGQNLQGTYQEFQDYVPDLQMSGLNDDIESCQQTGVWLYYENLFYNTNYPGRTYIVHGVDYVYNFPYDYQNIISSMRFAGDRSMLNADYWNLYDGEYFTGQEMAGGYDQPSLGAYSGTASSLIVTGQSPWTFYTGESYTGYGTCVYPNTIHDVGPMGERLDAGLYPQISTAGIQDNSVRSVRKGCWA